MMSLMIIVILLGIVNVFVGVGMLKVLHDVRAYVEYLEVRKQ